MKRPNTDRKKFIEKILGTELSHTEYVRLKQEQFRFWQSPGKYVSENTDYIGRKKRMIALQDIKDWLESIRS